MNESYDISVSEFIAASDDVRAMLEHYVSGRSDNWDGTTLTQAKATLRDYKKAKIALVSYLPGIDP